LSHRGGGRDVMSSRIADRQAGCTVGQRQRVEPVATDARSGGRRQVLRDDTQTVDDGDCRQQAALQRLGDGTLFGIQPSVIQRERRAVRELDDQPNVVGGVLRAIVTAGQMKDAEQLPTAVQGGDDCAPQPQPRTDLNHLLVAVQRGTGGGVVHTQNQSFWDLTPKDTLDGGAGRQRRTRLGNESLKIRLHGRVADLLVIRDHPPDQGVPTRQVRRTPPPQPGHELFGEELQRFRRVKGRRKSFADLSEHHQPLISLLGSHPSRTLQGQLGAPSLGARVVGPSHWRGGLTRRVDDRHRRILC
jgi:hypothetical protein